MLEVEVDGDTEVIVNTNVEVTAGNMNVAIIEDTNDIEVTVNRQEYVITGDEIYIPKRFEDAPTWMQNLINQVVDVSISAQILDMNRISQSLESMIDAMEVAKNTYELSIISSNDIDERINTAVTTLNSAMNEADATVLEVAQTRVTPEEASAITVDVITAELAKTEAGTLGATVSNLQTAVANEEEARSTSIEILTSSIEGAFDANATAMNYINTYVGLDEVGASTGTGLSGYLEGSTGIIGEADSKVVNNVYVDALGNAKSKFEYGSTVSVNGVTSTAGFGLSNSTGTGIGSEFWINAAKFKFTNNNKTGSKAPFTIDATGTVPEITFNGKVSFNNVTDYTPPDISGTINNNNDVFAQRLGYLSYADMVAAATNGQTIINAGYLRTSLIEANSIVANQIDTVGLVAENISSNTIEGKTITGGTINGAIIIGATIRASYLELDGEIQVLTTFYLCVDGDTTGVPALAISEGRYRTYNALIDTDAILPEGNTNIYKIPTLSFISEPVANVNISNAGYIATSTIRSYNNASAGHNLKATKRQPNLLYIRSVVTQINCPIPQWNIASQVVYANSQVVQIYLFGSSIGTFQVRSRSELYSTGEGFAELWKTELYYNGAYQGKWEWSGDQGATKVFTQSGRTIITGIANGISWEIKLIETGFLTVEVWADNVLLPMYFNDINMYALKVVTNTNPDYTVNTGMGGTYYRPTASMVIGSGKLSINNML